MLLLAVRISRTFEEVKGFFEGVAKECSACIVYQHDADDDVSRTHVHAVIQEDDLNIEDEKAIKNRLDTLKARVRTCLKVASVPRTDWSWLIKLGDPKEPVSWDYITYMSKGNLKPVLASGVPVDIPAMTAKWVPMMGTTLKVQYKVEKYLTAAQMKQTFNQMIDEVISRLGDDWTKENILNVLLKYISEKRLIIGRYKVRDMFDTICNRTARDTFRRDMAILCRFPEPRPDINIG